MVVNVPDWLVAAGRLLLGVLVGVVLLLAAIGAVAVVEHYRGRPLPAPGPSPRPGPAPTPAPGPDPKPRPPFPSTWRNPIVAEHEFAHLCGWVPDFPTRPSVAGEIPELAQAGPWLTADRSKSVLLYKVWREVFADYPDYPAQLIGDCTSFAHGHAHDLLMTVEAYLGDLEFSAIGRTCTEAWYACGREAGGMLRSGDGCYGSAILKAGQTMGLLRYGDLPEDERAYSGRRARQWGRSGLPDELKPIAAARTIQGAMLNSVDGMIAALQSGRPCTISTSRGFTTTRDAQGFCRLKGRWGHCMGVVGYRADRPGFLVIQSWGPKTPDGPTDLDQPPWSFWCAEADMASIIAEGDSTTLSSTPGFAPRRLPAALTSA
jgi:hypothetical protein